MRYQAKKAARTVWLLQYISRRTTIRIRRLHWLTWLMALAVVSFIVPASLYAASVAKGYSTSDQQLQVGMAASLVSSNGNVERATDKSQDNFVGIVTTKEQNSLVVTGQNQNVYVTTEGQTKALVTDVGGEIKRGDHLSLSPLRGYLMRGQGSDLKSVAIALEDFTVGSSVKLDVTDANDQPRSVQVASVGVEVRRPEFVDVTYSKRPLLSNFARSLTGKEVSQWQVAVALIIFFVLLVAIGSVIYSAVHSTIEALGRNPLAKADIYKEFMQVLLISVAILVFGGLMIFALLWL
jgi:hypothetical protein